MRYLIGALVIVAIGIGSFFVFHKQIPKAESALPPAKLTVLSPDVWLHSGNSRSTVEGTVEVRAGADIETGTKGRAEITFPDGSVARLDHDTRLRIDEEFFDQASSASQTSLFLSIGRVWSRVVSLATPASSWEVKTSNIVAAVRGTAFDVSVGSEGKSRVFVADRTVHVAALDPRTAATIKTATLEANQIVEADARLPKEEIKLEIQRATGAEDSWVQDNRTRDNEITPQLENRAIELKRQATEFQKTLERDNTTLERYIEIRKTTKSNETIEEGAKTETPVLESKQTLIETEPTKPEGSGATGGAPSVAKHAVRLMITNAQRELIEGTAAQFKATVIFTDGTSLDVTAKALWSVKGPIGSIRAGLLAPEITDAFLAETGKAEGSILAHYEFNGTPLDATLPVTVTSSPGGNIDDTLG